MLRQNSLAVTLGTMPDRSRRAKKRPSDLNALASFIVNEATQDAAATEVPAKNPAAVALGRLGGLKGGAARAKSLSKAKRAAIAKKAAKARWAEK